MQRSYRDQCSHRLLSRRRFLAGGATTALALAGWLGSACSSSNNNNNSKSAATATSANPGGVTTPGGGAGAAATSRSAATAGPNASPAAANIKRGGLLITVIAQDYDSVDPHTYIPSTTEETLREVYENLVGADAQGQYSATRSVSQSWEQVSPTEFVFTLRPGVKFHDGSDLTAEVVQWNYQDLLDPSRNSPRKAPFSVIDHMEAVDTTHFRLVLKQPAAGFFGDLSHPSSGLISKTAFDKLGADGIKGQAVGTGPFKQKEWKRSASFEVEAFPDYWDKGGADGRPLPYLAGIRWDIVPDPGVTAEALASAKIHILTGVSSDNYGRFSKDKKFAIDAFIGDGVAGMFFNHTIAPLDSRQNQGDNAKAIWAAIDRKKVLDIVYGGRGLPAYGGISPSMHKWAYSGDSLNVQRGPDPKTVKQLLANAGNPNGFDLPVITITPGIYAEVLQVLQSQLGPFGINLKIQPYDVATASAKMWTTDKNMPAFYAGYAETIDPNLKSSIAHGSKGAYCPEPDSFKASSPYFQLMDKLLAQGNATYDLKQRAAAYKALEEGNAQYAGMCYIAFPENDTAMLAFVKGYDHGPDNKKRLVATWLDV